MTPLLVCDKVCNCVPVCVVTPLLVCDKVCNCVPVCVVTPQQVCGVTVYLFVL